MSHNFEKEFNNNNNNNNNKSCSNNSELAEGGSGANSRLFIPPCLLQTRVIRKIGKLKDVPFGRRSPENC
jgi:hypothetical protein